MQNTNISTNESEIPANNNETSANNSEIPTNTPTDNIDVLPKLRFYFDPSQKQAIVQLYVARFSNFTDEITKLVEKVFDYLVGSNLASQSLPLVSGNELNSILSPLEDENESSTSLLINNIEQIRDQCFFISHFDGEDDEEDEEDDEEEKEVEERVEKEEKEEADSAQNSIRIRICSDKSVVGIVRETIGNIESTNNSVLDQIFAISSSLSDSDCCRFFRRRLLR